MQAHDELEAVEQVCERLATRFPQVPLETVEATAHEVYAEIDGPIRAYVPVLVEHEARNRLAALAARTD